MACDNMSSPRGSIDVIAEPNDDESHTADAPELVAREFLCSWCFKRTERPYATHEFGASDAEKVRKIFCSESCFGHYRRALFKQSSVCDWCKDACSGNGGKTAHASDSHGQQFNFCSDKCLLEYENSVSRVAQSPNDRLQTQNGKRIKTDDCERSFGQSNFGGRLAHMAKNSLSSASKCHLQKRPLRHQIAAVKKVSNHKTLPPSPVQVSIARHNETLASENKQNRPTAIPHNDRLSLTHQNATSNVAQHSTAPTTTSASSLSFAVDYLTTQAYYGYLQALFNQFGNRQSTNADVSLPQTSAESSTLTNAVKTVSSTASARELAVYPSNAAATATMSAAAAGLNRPADGGAPASNACTCWRGGLRPNGELLAPLSGCIPWLVPLPMPIPLPIPLAVPANWLKDNKTNAKDDKHSRVSQSTDTVATEGAVNNEEPLNLCKWTQ